MKNYQLLAYHKDYSEDNGYTFLLASKIRDFYKEHGGRINSLNEKVIALQEKYFETDGFTPQGQLKIKQLQTFTEKVTFEKKFFFWKKKVVTKVPGKMKWVIKEGVNFEDYQKEMNELMRQDIVPIHTNGNGLKIVSK